MRNKLRKYLRIIVLISIVFITFIAISGVLYSLGIFTPSTTSTPSSSFNASNESGTISSVILNENSSGLVSFSGSHSGFTYVVSGVKIYNISLTNTNSKAIEISNILANTKGFNVLVLNENLPITLKSDKTINLELEIGTPSFVYNGSLTLTYVYSYIKTLNNTQNNSPNSNNSSSSQTSCYITGGNSSYYGTTVLAHQGQTCQLQPDYYERLDFTTYGPTEIGGTFTVNNGIEAYVLNDQGLQQYNSTGQITSYQCLIGTSVISGSLNCEVPAGVWHIVLINDNQVSSEITFTSNITVSYVSYAEETPFTIVSQNTNWNLLADNYQWESFQLNSNNLVSGGFSSSNTVEGYIMDPTEFSNFKANGSTTSYYCTTGNVTAGSVGCELGPGTWYFVLNNPSGYSSANVNWESNLTAYGLSSTSYNDAPYDEQFGLTFASNFTVLTYNITAIAQDDTSGIGPAYLLNGLSNTGYWYQIGVSYNWPNGNQHYLVFDANYEVFSPNGTSIYPSNGGGGLSSFSGPVNNGDTITLTLYFSNGNVILQATDLNTSSYASFSYSAEGATEFVGNPTSTSTNGFFTGLMTEWYHTFPWYGSGSLVTYNPFGTVSSPAWLWVDEFFCDSSSANCQPSNRIPLFFNSTSSTIYPSYTFTSNAALLKYLTNGEFTTGSANNSTSGSISSGNSGGSCLSSVQMGSYATESTGGTCIDYVVQMGDYSTYTNYQDACPSVIQGGSYDIYYNNVSGCNPTIQLGYGSKSCYLGSCN